MGHKDLAALDAIYQKAKEICNVENLQFQFTVDHGDYETAIQFKEIGINQVYHAHPPYSEDWESNPEIICPDIMDYAHKIIIEYEEESGNRKPGAHLAKKGHGHPGDLPTKRDTRRNRYYELGGFHFLQYWESDLKAKNWEKLRTFLRSV